MQLIIHSLNYYIFSPLERKKMNILNIYYSNHIIFQCVKSGYRGSLTIDLLVTARKPVYIACHKFTFIQLNEPLTISTLEAKAFKV